MKYTQYKIVTVPEKLEELQTFLVLHLDADLQIRDPRELAVFDEDNTGYEWNYVDEEVLEDREASISFFLPEGEELPSPVEEFLRSCTVETEELDDSLWMNNLQGRFVPTRYGEHVIAKPAWSEYGPQEGDVVIDIDPGMAFGTGTSPTTALALELLERHMIPGARVMDVGCGTGILGILAAKMGAREVRCMDIDPLAVECTANNIAINGVGDTVSVEQRDLVRGLDFTADIVVANLTVDILERLFALLRPFCARDCTLIASGIIREKENVGLAAVIRAGFVVEEILREGEWVAIAARK